MVLNFEPYFGRGVEIEEITTRNSFSLFFKASKSSFLAVDYCSQLFLSIVSLKKMYTVLALKDDKNMS